MATGITWISDSVPAYLHHTNETARNVVFYLKAIWLDDNGQPIVIAHSEKGQLCMGALFDFELILPDSASAANSHEYCEKLLKQQRRRNWGPLIGEEPPDKR